MIFGMSIATFTLLHVVLSLIGIFAGAIVVFGMLSAKRLNGWTALFLATTVLTSVTGFFFPVDRLMPSHIVGVISLVVLAVAMLGLQLVVVGAVAVLFSSFTSSTLAAIFTLSVAIAGQLTNEMRSMWQGSSAWLGKLVWYAVPNLGALSLNESVVYRTAVPAATWLAAAYAALYAATALAIASAAFERRDLR